MSKKRDLLIKFSKDLLTVAPIMALGIKSQFIFGEPKLPDKLKKQQ